MIAQAANSTANEFPRINPDVCIVNYYTNSEKLGLHQDKDESESSLTKGLPFISISIGDTAEFLFGNTREKTKQPRSTSNLVTFSYSVENQDCYFMAFPT
ncbi:hypothetical protein U9M48_033042 [Paspalum notatum var. saurae]|uniref:Alpha-ketoglutarate-dependent dioxygenase AlkB-like domain-containing protein n=1 Tax=Paspalum notatum var. saurae TaxID=547442 RepID=A0AAQ3U970_PASNO